MTQILDFSWVYPIPPYAVFQMATRLDHLDEKARYLGHEGHAVKELRERDGVFRSVTEREVEVSLPWLGRLLRFLPKNRIRQTQLWSAPEWDGSRRYTTTVEVSGVPVSITGYGTLDPIDIGQTHYQIHLEVHSPSRLLGWKVEPEVTRNTAEVLNGEHDFRQIWLSRTVFNR